MPVFSILKWWHRHAHSHSNRDSNWKSQIAGKTVIYWPKMISLKFIFWDEGHLYPNCLFYILPSYHKCFLFYFLAFDIRMHISIVTQARKGRISDWKHGYILLKNGLLKFNFWDQGHLYANCLLYILNICCKRLLFLIRNRGICMHIPMIQNGCINP